MNINESIYNEDYYERGLALGLSGYLNYSWMPELTLKMVHFFITELNIKQSDIVLDYGCAKGYIVKAFRLLNINCFGVDISDYAIKYVDSSVNDFCYKINGCSSILLENKNIDWLIAKDVFEHINHSELVTLLNNLSKTVKNIFVVVPLSVDDFCERYIIEEYENDITHVIRKSASWWNNLFVENEWQVTNFSNKFIGCKENWSHSHNGNGFFILSNKKFNHDC